MTRDDYADCPACGQQMPRRYVLCKWCWDDTRQATPGTYRLRRTGSTDTVTVTPTKLARWQRAKAKRQRDRRLPGTERNHHLMATRDTGFVRSVLKVTITTTAGSYIALVASAVNGDRETALVAVAVLVGGFLITAGVVGFHHRGTDT